MKLDQTDKKIIQLLGADARMSNNQMAKVIGVTEGTVRNRIQKPVSYTHLTLPTNREV